MHIHNNHPPTLGRVCGRGSGVAAAFIAGRELDQPSAESRREDGAVVSGPVSICSSGAERILGKRVAAVNNRRLQPQLSAKRCAVPSHRISQVDRFLRRRQVQIAVRVCADEVRDWIERSGA